MADIKLYSITDSIAVANSPATYIYKRDTEILREEFRNIPCRKVSNNWALVLVTNMRDVTLTGHYGTRDTEIVIWTIVDLENDKVLIKESYANN